MTTRSAVWLVILLSFGAPHNAVANTYLRYRKVIRENSCGATGTSHNSPCCSVDGWDYTYDELHHPTCPTKYDIERVAYSCSTDQQSSSIPGMAAQNCCGCGPPDLSCAGGLDPTTMIDDAIIPQSYKCDRNDGQPEPEQCDGQSASATPVDPGCGNDEHKCNVGDSDPAPIRYSSGRVESNPIVLFQVPAPDEILFGYRILYNSMSTRAPAQRTTIGMVHDDHPVIHHSQEDTHFIGTGWLDNFSDRLFVTSPNTPATQISWINQNGTVTFTNRAGVWTSWSGTYELIDRGSAPADGFGRWIVRSADPATPRRIWAFEEQTYAPYDGGATQRYGRLRRRAVLSSDLSNLTGRYGFTVTWTSAGTIDNATDTLGRILRFDYVNEIECVRTDPGMLPPDNCIKSETRSIRLSAVRYQPNAAAVPVVVAALQVTGDTDTMRLERVERPPVAGYTRFLYHNTPASPACVHCAALLTDVILAGSAMAASPAQFAPVMDSEVVLEHDDYGPGQSSTTLVGIHSKSPGREFAYEYSGNMTTQFDLTQDAGVCGAGNTCTAPGYACRAAGQLTPHCYAADVMVHDSGTALSTSHVTANTGSTRGGNSNAFTRS